MPIMSASPAASTLSACSGPWMRVLGDDWHGVGHRLEARVQIAIGEDRPVPIRQMRLDGVEVALAQREVVDVAILGEPLARSRRVSLDAEPAFA